MSVSEEKKFVIKHVFKDVMNKEKNRMHFAEPEIHYNIPWKLGFRIDTNYTYFYLECEKFRGAKQWSIRTRLDMKLTKTSGEKAYFPFDHNYSDHSGVTGHFKVFTLSDTANYLIDGNLTVEFQVTINKIEGIEREKLRNFEDDLAKEVSDVVLVVGDQNFYVLKTYLAAQSSYFKSLFLGKFEESGKSEVELKDIDPNDFQNFLEVLYVEPAVEEDTYEKILKLADMYDSKTAMKQCEEFLIYKSSRTLPEKFKMAMKYKLDELTKKCLSEMKTIVGIKSVLPEDSNQIVPDVWRKMLDIALVTNQ